MNRGKLRKLLAEEKDWGIRENYKDGYNVVRTFGKVKKKTIMFTLICEKGKVYIKHPSYEFVSTVSHFSSVETDKRLSLNKSYLRSIIKSLKKVGIWDSVENKQFLEINKSNPKSNKATVNRELKTLLR